MFSSSNVRYLLAHGRIRDANAILGTLHAVEGEVVHGEHRGRTIGYPTANLASRVEGYVPVDGVYAGWLIDLGEVTDETPQGTQNARLDAHWPWRWPAAISIGTKPTFSATTGRHERVVEAYALTNDDLDLYGHRVRVEFTQFLRPQAKFKGLEELKAALAHDAEQTASLTQVT